MTLNDAIGIYVVTESVGIYQHCWRVILIYHDRIITIVDHTHHETRSLAQEAGERWLNNELYHEESQNE